ncbi:MAG: hypothetical protein WCO57_08125 [Verrucomicrobiota bacterium]
MTPPPKTIITVPLDQTDAEALERPIKLIGRHLNMDRDATLSHVLLSGAVKAMVDISQRIERQNTAAEGIRKLKAEEDVSIEELDAVFNEAQDGNLDARIVVADFKRFGRSMAKDR